MTGVRGFALRVCEWIVRLASVNGLWIGFSLLGGLIGGCFPALQAMFVVMKKWCMNEEEFPLVQMFFDEWKRSFWRANKIGYTILGIGAILIFDYVIVMNMEFTGSHAVAAILVSCLVVYGLFLLFIGPAIVHFNNEAMFSFLKNVVLFSVASLPYALMMGVFLGLAAVLFFLLPPAAVCFAGSLFAWITTHFSLKALQRSNELGMTKGAKV